MLSGCPSALQKEAFVFALFNVHILSEQSAEVSNRVLVKCQFTAIDMYLEKSRKPLFYCCLAGQSVPAAPSDPEEEEDKGGGRRFHSYSLQIR